MYDKLLSSIKLLTDHYFKSLQYLSKHSGVEGPPVGTGVGDDNVMVFVDAHYRTSGTEAFEHAVRPAAVSVLKRLDYLQVQVYIHL